MGAVVVSEQPTDERRPFWVKCMACAHCWPAAYLPMKMSACAKLLKRATCPMCGTTGKKIGVAKQNDGELLEHTETEPEGRAG